MTYVGMSAKVEIAFVANPYSSALVWTDVTSRVAKLKTTTGRNYETGKNESSSVNVELRNNDGALNPMNTASPYYPYVLPFRPIRITASTVTTTTTTGSAAAYPSALYPGTTTPGVTTATSPTTTTTTGPSYPIWYGYVSSWPQSVKDQTSQYEMVNVVGVDAFKAVLGFVPGDPYDVKVRKDYGAYTAPGLSSTAWNFFPFDEATGPFVGENGGAAGSAGTVTKSSPSPCRTAIALTGTGAVVAGAPASFAYPQGELWFNPTTLPTAEGQFFCIYAVPGNATPPSVMELTPTGYSAQVMQMIGLHKTYANRIPNDDASTFNTSTGGWTVTNGSLARSTTVSIDGSSLTITPTVGATTFTATSPTFPVTSGWNYLHAESAKNGYSATAFGNNSGTVVVQIAWFNSAGGLISASAPAIVSTTSANTSWQSVSGSGVAPVGAVTASLQVQGAGNGAYASGDLVNIDVTQAFTDTGRGATYVPPASSVYRLPSVGSTVALVAQLPTTATNTSPAAAGAHLARITPPALNQWHHVAFVPQTVAGTGLLVLDGVTQPLTLNTAVATSATQVSSPVLGAASTLSGVVYFGFYGAIAGVYVAGTATGLNNISQTYAVQHYNYGTTATGAARTHDFPSESTSARVTDVLMAIGFPTAMSSLEAGLSTMTASGNVSGVTATNLLVAAAEAELGNVFVDRNGVVTFHNRNHRNSPTTAATFGGDGNIPYEGNIAIGFDDTYIFNDVQITQAQTTPAYVFEAQDVTSQNVYGVRTQQQTLQVTAQSDVQGMAATLLARYKDPRPRLATLSIELRSKPNYIPNVFGLRVGDLITINHKPPGGTMFTLQCFIDGVSHTVDQGQWTTTFNTTPFYPNTTY